MAVTFPESRTSEVLESATEYVKVYVNEGRSMVMSRSATRGSLTSIRPRFSKSFCCTNSLSSLAGVKYMVRVLMQIVFAARTISCGLEEATAADDGDCRFEGNCNAAPLPSARFTFPSASPITASMGTANPTPEAAPLVMIPTRAPPESTSGPPLAPPLTGAVNCNTVNPCPAPFISSASLDAAKIPALALQARPLELETTYAAPPGLASALDPTGSVGRPVAVIFNAATSRRSSAPSNTTWS